MTLAPNADQRHIRRCAVTAGLLLHGTANPPLQPHDGSDQREQAARKLSSVDIDEALAHTDAVAATYRLAASITRLEPELLALLASDQITHDTIAGYAIPQRARPVLLALGDRNGPIFHRTPSTPALTTPRGRQPPLTGHLEHSDLKALVAGVLGHLMFGRARSFSNTALPANVRAQLDALVADGILDAQRGTYRASHVALYSCYQLACAPARSTDNQMAQVTDAGWQTH